MVREFKDEYEAEFTDEQLERLDEIDNAAYDFACIMTCMCSEDDEDEVDNEDEILEWDMDYIGDIVDAVSGIMQERGYKIYYPFMTKNKDGKMCTYDYVEEEDG